MKLRELGLDRWLADEAGEPCEPDLSAARVTAVDRGRYLVRGEHGEAPAELRDAQRAAEKARQAHAAAEEKARKDAERAAQVEADAALKKDQKAARDSKYAARKARQK